MFDRKICLYLGLMMGWSLAGCSKTDHDLSWLYGQWETSSLQFTVLPADQPLRQAVQESFPYDAFRLEFDPNGQFYEAHSMNGQFVTMVLGNYFYNHGYKGRFVHPSLMFDTRHFEPVDQQLMFAIDLTEYYRNTPPQGFEDFASHAFEQIRLNARFERAEFYSLFDE